MSNTKYVTIQHKGHSFEVSHDPDLTYATVRSEEYHHLAAIVEIMAGDERPVYKVHVHHAYDFQVAVNYAASILIEQISDQRLQELASREVVNWFAKHGNQ